MEPLSNIELYYFPSIEDSTLPQVLEGEDVHHITNVMKHRVGSTIHITDGRGCLFEAILCKILNHSRIEVTADVKSRANPAAPSIVFYLPILKSTDRLEFALEKLVELGYTNINYYRPIRSISKSKLLNENRLTKIAVSAMKQSLNLWLPRLKFDYNLKNISLNDSGENVIFESFGSTPLDRFMGDMMTNIQNIVEIRLFFGPEGGLDSNEIDKIQGARIIRLTENRLRSETAAVYVGSVLRSYILKGVF